MMSAEILMMISWLFELHYVNCAGFGNSGDVFDIHDGGENILDKTREIVASQRDDNDPEQDQDAKLQLLNDAFSTRLSHTKNDSISYL